MPAILSYKKKPNAHIINFLVHHSHIIYIHSVQPSIAPATLLLLLLLLRAVPAYKFTIMKVTTLLPLLAAVPVMAHPAHYASSIDRREPQLLDAPAVAALPTVPGVARQVAESLPPTPVSGDGLPPSKAGAAPGASSAAADDSVDLTVWPWLYPGVHRFDYGFVGFLARLLGGLGGIGLGL